MYKNLLICLVLLIGAAGAVNHAPTVPVVTGPQSLAVNAQGTYSATSTDQDGNTIKYDFNCLSDTYTSALLTSSTPASYTAYWGSTGVKAFRVRAVDQYGLTSAWRDYPVTVVAAGNQAPSMPTVTGPTTLVINVQGSYSAVSTDANGDAIKYEYNYLEDTYTSGLLASGTPSSFATYWASIGTKAFRVRAVDEHGIASSWRDYPVTVTNGGAPLMNIQNAINAAASGSTINIPVGTYYENLHITKAITLAGAGSGQTIIDGGADGRVVEVVEAGVVTLSGMTIQNGASDYGAGIWNLGRTTLLNCVVTGNTVTGWGGGINSFGGSTLVITSSQITGNHADQFGGGIVSDGAGTITGSTVSGNTASWGAGMYCDGPGTSVSTSTISGNTANEYGGGILNDWIVNIASSTITGNTANTNGGGGIANYGDMVDAQGNVDYDVSHNIHYRQAVMTITGTTISNNVAQYGGAIVGDGITNLVGGAITGNHAGKGAGIDNDGNMALDGVEVSGNVASGYGGGIYNDDTISIKDGSLTGNSAQTGWGGGLFNGGGTLSFAGTTQITGNSAHYPASQGDWYHGWGVNAYIGVPTISGGFNPATQVTGNTHI